MKRLIILTLSLILGFAVVNTAFAQKPIRIILTKNNHVSLNESFNNRSIAIVKAKLFNLSFKTRKDLYLVLNTPGGSVSAGESLYDFIEGLPNRVHTITLFAASMGYHTVQTLGRRYVTSASYLMSHRVRIGGLGGQIPGEAVTRMRLLEKRAKFLDTKAANRVGLNYNQYRDLIKDELWLGANDAIAQGHADRIAIVSCDASLKGFIKKSVRTFFGNFNVVFSKCPLITGAISVNSGRKDVRSAVDKMFNFNEDSKIITTF